MLLNATHEITCAGLPPHIQERYVRYKQGNRAIVAWMTRYGPERYRGKKTLPIKQLIALGKHLCRRVNEVGTLPSDVDYYFKEVIRDRAYLSTHFRMHRDQCEEDKIDTINHEHFTDSLKQIHAILLTAGKPSERAPAPTKHRHSPKNRLSSSSVSEIRRGFTHLLLQSDEHNERSSDASESDSLSDVETDATSECSHSMMEEQVFHVEDNPGVDFLDSEGALGSAVEVTLFLQKLSKICDAITLCWVKAGTSGASLAAKAAYTNVLIARAIAHLRAFQLSEPELLTPSDLQKCLSALGCDLLCAEEHGQPTVTDLVSALQKAESSVKARTRTSKIVTSPRLAITTPSNQPQLLLDELANEFHGLCSDTSLPKLSSNGLGHLRSLSFPDTELRSETLLSASLLHLTSVSHCAYSSTLAKPSYIAYPRILALKLANEALGSIREFVDDKNIFPCRCVNTLGYRIVQMKDDLESFAKHKCWNTLMQSPQIAGNHVLEILDLCSFYGMHLFHYRQYVAAVLHTYQALVRLHDVDSIAILEEVCELFAPILYTTGQRPDSGFVASWLRYIGARLRFNNGRKHRNHQDSWCMAVPAHAAARSAGLNISGKDDKTKVQPKFDFGTIDEVIRLKHHDWILSNESTQELIDYLFDDSADGALSQVIHSAEHSLEQNSSRRTRHKRSKSCYAASTPGKAADSPCSNLDHFFENCVTIDAPEGRNLPSLRFNLLSFFHTMTKIVSGISAATHAEDEKSSKDKGRGQMCLCLCFVQTILRGADRIQDARKRHGLGATGTVWTQNEKECIECYKHNLMKVLGEAGVLEGSGGLWLWTSMQ